MQNLSYEPFAYLKNKVEIRLVQKTLYLHSSIYKFLRKSSTIILLAKGNENYTCHRMNLRYYIFTIITCNTSDNKDTVI